MWALIAVSACDQVLHLYVAGPEVLPDAQHLYLQLIYSSCVAVEVASCLGGASLLIQLIMAVP